MNRRVCAIRACSLVGVLCSALVLGCSHGSRRQDPDGDADLDAGADADLDPDVEVEADAEPDSAGDAEPDREEDAEVDGEVADAELDADEGPFDADMTAVHDVEWALVPEIESLIRVSWVQDVAGPTMVRYRVGEEEWQQTPTADRAVGSAEQLVLGVPFDSEFGFRVVVLVRGHEIEGDIISGRTGPVPETMPLPALVESVPLQWDPADLYLFGSISVNEGGWAPAGGFWAFIMDRQSRLLWARLTPRQRDTMYVRVSTDGRDLLIDDASYWSDFDEGAASTVHRIKIDGTIVETYPTPGLHHAFTELPDGSIVWGAAGGPAARAWRCCGRAARS